MATGRISRKVLDHIAQINKENKAMSLAKELKKEVETGKHGTQKYVVKQGENKGKIL
jgi:translation initiation factor 1 (eIF-1/SUI1)